MKYLVATILFFLLKNLMAQQTPCISPQVHEFDFWIGDWAVYKMGTDTLVGYNTIEPIEGGCALKENYRALKQGYTGTSLNKYHFTKRKWQQMWVDNSGLSLVLEGGLKDGNMIMEGEQLAFDFKTMVKNRITWFNNSDKSVRQLWEQSRDGGISWTRVFDGMYKPILAKPLPISIKPSKNLNPDVVRDRNYFDFLVGVWKLDSLITPHESKAGGKDIYTFTKEIDNKVITSNWYFNRGTPVKPDYAKGLYYMGYDSLATQNWNFYYLSSKSAQFYQGVFENNKWYFYISFDINGRQWIQRQHWNKRKDGKVERWIENSYDKGQTWTKDYIAILSKDKR
jgi:hypothetical protein